MRVRFSRVASIACLAAALLLGFLALGSTHASFVGAITPIAFLGFGIALATRPYLLIQDSALIVKALIGPAQTTYALNVGDVLDVRGTRVFLVDKTGRRRLRGVTGWLAHRRDWAAFRAWADTRAAGLDGGSHAT